MAATDVRRTSDCTTYQAASEELAVITIDLAAFVEQRAPRWTGR